MGRKFGETDFLFEKTALPFRQEQNEDLAPPSGEIWESFVLEVDLKHRFFRSKTSTTVKSDERISQQVSILIWNLSVCFTDSCVDYV